MLKGMAVFNTASHKAFSMKQVVSDAHIEIIETWSLHQTPFHYFSISRYAVTDECVLKNVEIGAYGGGMHTTFLEIRKIGRESKSIVKSFCLNI